METNSGTVGFIGAGHMANALIKGLLNSKLYETDKLIASDNDEKKLKEISDNFGLKAYSSNSDLIRKCQIIVLSVKPQVIRDVLEEALGGANPRYQAARRAGKLDILKLCLVRPGTFAAIKQMLIRRGASPNQVKIPRVIRNDDTYRYLRNHMSAESEAH